MINNDEIKIVARKEEWESGVQLLVKCRGDGGGRLVGHIVFEEVSEGLRTPAKSIINLSQTSAQLLMDELWNCGIRPSEGTGSAGSLRKTEDHLKDMRKIVGKALKMEL